MQQKTEAFEKRINTLIRDFVKVFKKLVAEFTNYKSINGREQDIFNMIITKKQEIIDRQAFEVNEYKQALRIPRQHYKYIEKLKFDELMKQRDSIIKKFMKKFGVDKEKALSMMVMPDPSLPPEKQMEMLTGGKLVQGAQPVEQAAPDGQASAKEVAPEKPEKQVAKQPPV